MEVGNPSDFTVLKGDESHKTIHNMTHRCKISTIIAPLRI